jgi:hypothetical protein
LTNKEVAMPKAKYKPEQVIPMLREAQIVIEQWRVHYNTVRPHSSLGYRPPAPEAALLPSPLPPCCDGSRRTRKV